MQDNKQGNDKDGQGLTRINKYLAQCGLGARRKCDELVESGHIYVNGQKVTELGFKVNSKVDRVEYKGRQLRPIRKLEYYAYCKPREVMVTNKDPEGRLTIYEALRRDGLDADLLKYVGRLDYLSEGLLLLTNDGDLIHALTHPRFAIKKVYRVRIGRPLEPADIKKLIDGVESEGQLLRAASVDLINIKDDQYWYEIALMEGKNRQIRRMLDGVGHEVRRLRRVAFGSVKLGDMKAGEYRELTPREIGGLKNAGFKNR
ncbi:MAG: rRNA pseudouridine synthase [Chitinispirillia bacterium]|nr:rRNA pseudouridine synthase [Chitinispirillia bacterium]MCL2268065.1 rRNA pseudouridine synthase [Chitinispirillia bacterium]